MGFVMITLNQNMEKNMLHGQEKRCAKKKKLRKHKLEDYKRCLEATQLED